MEDVRKQIKSFLQQAELYQSQGLLNEARENYLHAGQLVKKNWELISNKNLLTVISKKIQALNDQISRFDNETDTVELPEEIQNIIRDKFAFSEDDAGALEGAIALAKFGQFERALKEFDELIKRKSVRVEAAKNIIRCHKALDSVENAIIRYQAWLAGNLFTQNQLNKLRVFFQGILDSKGINITLPEKLEKMDTTVPEIKYLDDYAETEEPEMPEEEVQDEDIIDISSVGITLSQEAKKGEIVECDVSFQAGSVINLLIPGDDKDLTETLETGVILNDVQFYSPMAMFNGKAVVSSKAMIESGPKEGYYSLDIKVVSIN
ncbi:hypothetical protein QUF72_18150 [Desulfobacterales bacterium HSG2]|nr:hypothetical protein [Desulfobacterales bacterium HSG2]